jgi:hypothetical protein
MLHNGKSYKTTKTVLDVLPIFEDGDPEPSWYDWHPHMDDIYFTFMKIGGKFN